MTTRAMPDGWSVFDQAPSALVIGDAELVVLRVNAEFCRLIGRPAAELVGRSAFELVHPAEQVDIREALAALLDGGGSQSVEQRVLHAAGHDVWLRLEAGLVRGEDGTAFVLAQVEDTTDRRRTTARLQRLAERDHLTGLLNRRRIEEELEAALAGIRRHGRRAALVLVDLDHFKDVNDRGGHEAGDRVLSFVAATLATRVREEDAVGRMGGDEFALLLRDTTLEAAEGVAAELVGRIADASYTRERGVTMSAGVAALTPETRNAQDALHAADLAMYAAKAAGRDRVAVHTPSSGPATPGAERDVGLAPLCPPGPDTRPPRESRASGSDRERGLLDGLQAVADAPSIEHALDAVRELLDMDIAYVTRHAAEEVVLTATRGDMEPSGMGVGDRFAPDETICAAVLRGDVPRAIPDIRAQPLIAEMAAERGIGAYAAVPIRHSDGSVYGMLCAANRGVTPRLGERDLQFLAVLARMVGGELERDATLRAQLELRVQAAGADALLSAIEARDTYTGAHSREVVELAVAVAAELDLPAERQREVAQVALLHDIGKLALPDAILSKRGPLTPEEERRMRRHPEDGARIVAAIEELAHLAPAIRAEHERWDGSGYPDGLAGEAIPIASRIVFVCDAWDAMTSDRPYRAKMGRDEALAELADGASSQFCAASVQALFTVLARR